MTENAASKEQSNRGALLHLEGDTEGAKEAYRAALEADAGNATAHNNLGFLLAQDGRLDEAEAHLDRAIALNPKGSMAHANLGNVRAMQGDLDAALKHLRRAVALDDQNRVAWDNLGRLLFKIGRPREAEQVWSQAIEAAPLPVDGRDDGEVADAGEVGPLFVGLGMAVAAQGRLGEAVRLLRRAAALDPVSVEAWSQLGTVLFLRRDFGSAQEALARALAIDPNAVLARHQLGLVYLALGEREEARAQLERVARLNTGGARVAADLAALDLSEGRPADALKRLGGPLSGSTSAHGSVQGANQGDRVLFYRGVALDQLGRRDQALEVLQPLAQKGSSKYAAEARRYLREHRSDTKSERGTDGMAAGGSGP